MADAQDPEVLGGAAAMYLGTNIADPHVIAQQSGDTDQASALAWPLPPEGRPVNVDMPTGTAKVASNFEIHEGDNNGFVLNPGAPGEGEFKT